MELIEGFGTQHIALLASALLLGSMVFFSFIVLPKLRKALDPEIARTLITRLFVVYYAYCASLAMVAGVAIAFGARPFDAGAMAITGACFIFARTHLLPAIRRAQKRREINPRDQRAFRALHLISVLLNLAQIVVVAWVVIRFLPTT